MHARCTHVMLRCFSRLASMHSCWKSDTNGTLCVNVITGDACDACAESCFIQARPAKSLERRQCIAPPDVAHRRRNVVAVWQVKKARNWHMRHSACFLPLAWAISAALSAKWDASDHSQNASATEEQSNDEVTSALEPPPADDGDRPVSVVA